MINGVGEYQSMKTSLVLRSKQGKLVTFIREVILADVNLPFQECIPDKTAVQQHSHTKNCDIPWLQLSSLAPSELLLHLPTTNYGGLEPQPLVSATPAELTWWATI